MPKIFADILSLTCIILRVIFVHSIYIKTFIDMTI